MRIAFGLCGIGIFIGFVIGEYYPELFTSGIGFFEILSSPYSNFRNNLATKYALIIGTIGFVLGLLISISLSQQKKHQNKSHDKLNSIKNYEAINSNPNQYPQAPLIIATIITILVGSGCWWFVNMNRNTQKTIINGQYKDNGDGTVTNIYSRLMWKKCSEGQSGDDCSGNPIAVNWIEAFNQADTTNKNGGINIAGLKLGGGFANHKDWRLPSVNELKSLADTRHTFPAINQHFFPNMKKESLAYWSSSPSTFNEKAALIVDFDYGLDEWEFKNNNYCVRLVRSCN